MLVNRSAYCRLFYVSEGQSTFFLVLLSSGTGKLYVINIAFMTFGSKEKPAKHSPLSLRHFLFFSQIFFYMLLFLPCFSFPQSSEVITVLWSCVMEPAVINLMNSAQSPPFIVLPLKCKLHCVNVRRL